MSLQSKFDVLAEKLAERAADGDTSIEDATNALKAVTAYLAVLRKPDRSGLEDIDLDDASGFDFMRGIQSPEDKNGSASRIPGRRRNG